MTTVRDICEKALQRIRIVPIGDTAPSEHAAYALDSLNGMLQAWVGEGVNCAPPTFALSDTFAIFVPHNDVTGATMAALEYQGTWDASTNTPTLTGETGTQGHLYKVATAGSTSIDGEASWAVGDYLIFNGDYWRKGKSSARFEHPVIDLLAENMCEDYGKEMTPGLAKAARSGWNAITSEYVRVDPATFDSGLRFTPARRFYGVLEG